MLAINPSSDLGEREESDWLWDERAHSTSQRASNRGKVDWVSRSEERGKNHDH